MAQDIITFLIVSMAVMISATRLLRFFSSASSKKGGCSDGCSGCPVSDLKKDIAGKRS